MLFVVTGLNLGFAATARATSEDPCYGITIHIQSEIDSQRAAKILASGIRKRHRLATVPPVEAISAAEKANSMVEEVIEKPAITFHRPTDFSCAIALSSEAEKHAKISVQPQTSGRSEFLSVGLIQIWWPANTPALIADFNEK